MTDFMSFAVGTLAEAAPGTRVGVVQFSNDCRVELPPTEVEVEAFNEVVMLMVRGRDSSRARGGGGCTTTLMSVVHCPVL
jgi:hypothetical protein